MSKNSKNEIIYSSNINCEKNFKNGKAENLQVQAQKIMRKTNRGGLNTRRTYAKKYDKFLEFVGKNFNTKNVKNINSKHVYSYVEHMKQKKLSNNYIKTSLSAIRFCHELTDSKNLLPNNEMIQQKTGMDLTRVTRGASRSWTDEETKKAIELAYKYNRQDVALTLLAAQKLSLRLNEACTLSADNIRKALRTLELAQVGKGGKKREIPINAEEKKQLLQEILDSRQRDDYVFLKQDQTVAQAKKSIQNFISNHRYEFQNSDRISSKEAYSILSSTSSHVSNFEGIPTALSFHGCRHTYAKQEYKNKLNDDKSNEHEAKREVSKDMGHGREEVTNIYLK